MLILADIQDKLAIICEPTPKNESKIHLRRRHIIVKMLVSFHTNFFKEILISYTHHFFFDKQNHFLIISKNNLSNYTRYGILFLIIIKFTPHRV